MSFNRGSSFIPQVGPHGGMLIVVVTDDGENGVHAAISNRTATRKARRESV